MIVNSLHIYPVKSLGKIALETAFAGEKGFAFDRKWMIVDLEGNFISQREYPFLSKIEVNINNNFLVITDHKNESEYRLEISSMNDGIIPVKIWGDSAKAQFVDNSFDQWISEKVGKEVKLVKMEESFTRYTENSDRYPTASINFADSFPYLIANLASLEDLNSKLTNQVGIERFRPNIVVDGDDPFIEDNWRKIRIGEVAFTLTRPCPRCKMINIDPDSGIMHEKEPLLTLSSYRKSEAGITFGVYMIAENNGKISKGDPVEVLEQA